MDERDVIRAIAAARPFGLTERKLWRWWRGEWAGPMYLPHAACRALERHGIELVDAAVDIFGRPRWYRRIPPGTIRIRLGGQHGRR